MKKYRLKKIKNLNKKNHKNLLETGFNYNNVFLQTYDYNLNTIMKTPIKEIKKNEIKKFELEDPFYFKYHTEQMYKNINRVDCLFGDLWRIGTKNRLLYLTVITPHLRHVEEEYIDYEIATLIKKHYRKIFGYENKVIKLKKIKKGKYKNFYEINDNNSPEELIKLWVNENKNSEIYNYYKNLILKHNDIAINQKEISFSFYPYDKNVAELIIPFNCELTYPILFEMVLTGKIKKEEHINEDYIKKDLNEELINFLKKFTYKKYKKKGRK